MTQIYHAAKYLLFNLFVTISNFFEDSKKVCWKLNQENLLLLS